MTLLAFNVHVPNGPLTDPQLTHELRRMRDRSGGLLLSFAVAAMFWMRHFRLFRRLRQADYPFALINFGLLFSIVLLPISFFVHSPSSLGTPAWPWHSGRKPCSGRIPSSGTNVRLTFIAFYHKDLS